ncbi:GGDEF domain-containing protein [Halarcobacter mediterraneus]|uniref:GGDEF domain-containing protein n=1 Tax=Halarcobacter mediterraneus TaxID=2023153 RepID=A0A4Q1AWC8_9BACT|nr:GGDEF domain-containing protein [Halarcobacter mediterraneus]RXK14365.1 GGDEF domain-containing protein [Halarcobacter mediterraneus]
MNNNFNSYNFQTIIALNDHLKNLKKLDDIFQYLSTYISKDFGINRFQSYINDKMIYSNFKENEETLKSKQFLIKLNYNDNLEVALFYKNEYELENIANVFNILKTTFNLVSQTIYNKYLEFKIKELSLRDSLTGLYNRQYIDEYLKTILPLSSREKKKIAFLKVGIDHFKAVIDEFDYTIGDKVLKELAISLENSVRESDLVARIDSDEFLVILHNVMNEENAIMVAQKVIENFKKKKVIVNEVTNQTLMKTICTGISMFPDDAKKVEDIFRSSDIALYEARNKGRSQLFKFKKEESNIIELF